MLTELSSRKMEIYWKIVYIYIGISIMVLSFIIVVVIMLNIDNPNIDKEFVTLFEENIYKIYMILGLMLIINLVFYYLFSKIVHIHIDSSTGKLYVDSKLEDSKNIKFIAEMVLFGMLVALIKIDGDIRAWIPRSSPAFNTNLLLPFFLRFIPRNKYVKLFHNALRQKGSPDER